MTTLILAFIGGRLILCCAVGTSPFQVLPLDYLRRSYKQRPVDLLVYVDNAKIVQMRLVCKRLEKAAVDEFERRFLNHLLVLHDERSVAKLQTIARQDRLNRYFRKSSISGEL
jgi:hypothetical protein